MILNNAFLCCRTCFGDIKIAPKLNFTHPLKMSPCLKWPINVISMLKFVFLAQHLNFSTFIPQKWLC